MKISDIKKFRDKMNYSNDIQEMLLKTKEEALELISAIDNVRKENFKNGEYALALENLREEMADNCISCVGLSTSLDWLFENILREKMIKDEIRGDR